MVGGSNPAPIMFVDVSLGKSLNSKSLLAPNGTDSSKQQKFGGYWILHFPQLEINCKQSQIGIAVKKLLVEVHQLMLLALLLLMHELLYSINAWHQMNNNIVNIH